MSKTKLAGYIAIPALTVVLFLTRWTAQSDPVPELGTSAQAQSSPRHAAPAKPTSAPRPMFPLEGRVVDENGVHIAGAQVAAWKTGSDGFVLPTLPLVSTHTGADGQWTLPWNGVGMVGAKVSAWTPKHAVTTVQVIAISGRTRPPSDIVLFPRKKFRIRLVDGKGKPAVGARLQLLRRNQRLASGPWSWSEGHGCQAPLPGFQSAVTAGKNGWVNIDFGTEGDTISVQCESPQFQREQFELVCPRDDGLQLRLNPGGSIHGRILDTAHRPLAGLNLQLTNQPRSKAVTNADGSFLFSSLSNIPDYINLVGSDLVIPVRRLSIKPGKITETGDLIASPGGVTNISLLYPNGLLEKRGGWLRITLASEPAAPQSWANHQYLGATDKLTVRLAPGTYSFTFNKSQETPPPGVTVPLDSRMIREDSVIQSRTVIEGQTQQLILKFDPSPIGTPTPIPAEVLPALKNVVLTDKRLPASRKSKFQPGTPFFIPAGALTSTVGLFGRYLAAKVDQLAANSATSLH